MRRPLALILVAFSVLPGAAVFGADTKPLNVLLIIADDLNCQLGCYGNAVVKTPNIDRLASLGVRFERSYANQPVCNPSRASFLSGRYPTTTNVHANGRDPRTTLGPTYQFLPEYFRAHGYYTAGVGKIAHGSFPDSIKWDYYLETLKGGEEDDDARPRAAKKGAAKGAKKGDTKAAEPGTAKPDEPKARNADAPSVNEPTDSAAGVKAGKKKGRAGETPGDSATRREGRPKIPFVGGPSQNTDEQEPDGETAVRISKQMEDHAGGEKPFFIAAGFHKPHVPHIAPKKYFDMYPPDKIELVKEPAGHEKLIPTIARTQKYYPDLTESQQQHIIADYYACTTFMDAQVGKLLDTMDRLKLWDHTVVVFMGDHGWHFGEHHGFWAKSSLMEESARAPLLVVAPGVRPAVSNRLVEFVDLFPTLTDLCGLPPQDGVEGLSLVPLLHDPQRPWKSAIFTVVVRGGPRELGSGLRTEQYNFYEWPDGSTQLYDHTKDPKEYVNLAADGEHSAVVAELQSRWKAGYKTARPKPE